MSSLLGNTTFCETLPKNTVSLQYSSSSQSGVIYSPRYLVNYTSANFSRGCYVELNSIPKRSYVTLNVNYNGTLSSSDCSHGSLFYLIKGPHYQLDTNQCTVKDNMSEIHSEGIPMGTSLKLFVFRENAHKQFTVHYTS